MPEELNGQVATDGQQSSSMPDEKKATDEELDFELPEDSTDRAKEQFNKLVEHNKKLAEENRQLKETKKVNPGSVFGGLEPPQMPKIELPKIDLPEVPGLKKSDVEDIISQVTDKDGYINETALKKALRDSQEAAESAKQESQKARDEISKIQENAQVREAHKEFPALDPKSSEFDPKFFEAVKNEIVSQLIRGEKDLVGAANKVAQWYPLKKRDDAAEEKKKEDQVEQINQTGSSASRSSSYTSTPIDKLAERTRAGDSSALKERLSRAGF